MLPYASAACSRTTHSSSEFAEAGRAHLYEELSDPTVDTVQTCCILALVDWGQGEIERAWTMSGASLNIPVDLDLMLTRTTRSNRHHPINPTFPPRQLQQQLPRPLPPHPLPFRPSLLPHQDVPLRPHNPHFPFPPYRPPSSHPPRRFLHHSRSRNFSINGGIET
jgi:hypothetical protein